MKKIICFLFALIYHLADGQTFTVLDSITKEPLPYTAVLKGDSGFYTDENGKFTIIDFTEKYIIKHLGYEDYIFHPSTLNDRILLHPHLNALDPVILKNKTQIKEISFLPNPKSFSFLPLSYGNEIITKLIPSEKNTNLFIESVSLSFIKNKTLKKSDSSSALIRINIYSEKDIFSSDPISLKLAENQNINLDLSLMQFRFDKEGIIIGIEVLKIESEHPTGIRSVNPGLTSASNEEYTQNSFFKYTFQNNQLTIPLEEFFEKGYTRKRIVRNLNISLVLTR